MTRQILKEHIENFRRGGGNVDLQECTSVPSPDHDPRAGQGDLKLGLCSKTTNSWRGKRVSGRQITSQDLETSPEPTLGEDLKYG